MNPGPGLALLPAAAYAQLAIANIERPWPQRLDGVLTAPGSYTTPRQEHPAFHGAYDWHSCVHMHWLLARLLAVASGAPGAPWEEQARQLLASRLTAANVAVELAFLMRAENRSFERTYGWAWLFKLHAELLRQKDDASAIACAAALTPLASYLRERYLDYLQRANRPIRAGTHANSAFAMLLFLDWTSTVEDVDASSEVSRRAHSWFGADRRYPAAYEPDAEDFLSGGLLEALLMSRVLGPADFPDWWDRFKPGPEGWQCWLAPMENIQRDDGKLVHQDGLNLSRAWCLRELEPWLPDEDGAQVKLAAPRHLQASLPHVASGDYVGEHWLASFAALALTGLRLP